MALCLKTHGKSKKESCFSFVIFRSRLNIYGIFVNKETCFQSSKIFKKKYAL